MTSTPTIRLFDADSHLFTFEATLISCEPTDRGGHYLVVLDRTAFFPEGGGQAADTGTILHCPVIDVQEQDGVIYHRIEATQPLTDSGAPLPCQVNQSIRFRRMQNHSGEHIVSGLVHTKYGFNNVGFHLGSEDVTLDFDGVLTREQLNEIEDEANRIVSACLPVKAYYPDAASLAAMDYRSKLELTENIRIVEIGEGDGLIDRCACCAPHVSNTGEIGLIKLLDFIHYKGGVRIHMLCGADALEDYRRRYTDIATLAASLSVKQSEIGHGFSRLQAEIEEKKQIIYDLRKTVLELTLAAIPETDGSLCLFENTGNPNAMRALLNAATGKCKGLCGVFYGNDAEGYRYVIGRGDPSVDLRAHIKIINTALSAKGGGSSEMLQGRCHATQEVIQAFFRTVP